MGAIAAVGGTAELLMHEFWIQGTRRQAKLRLEGSFFVIGRSERFGVFQDDPTISREHAAIVATPEGIRVKDLGSRNGVLKNGEKLARYAEVDLEPGDLLQIGNTVVRLAGEGDEVEGSEVTVDADGRTAAMSALDGGEPPEEALLRTQGFEPSDDPEETVDLDGVADDGLETDEMDLDLPGEETEILEDLDDADVEAPTPASEGFQDLETAVGGDEELDDPEELDDAELEDDDADAEGDSLDGVELVPDEDGALPGFQEELEDLSQLDRELEGLEARRVVDPEDEDPLLE